MVLVQLLLPIYDNDGNRFPRLQFEHVRRQLTDRFGGVTAYLRSPASGLWKEGDGTVVKDDIVMYEVMAERLEREWWTTFREQLCRDFRQQELVVRALDCEQL